MYIKRDRGYRADVLFNNIDVIDFLYVYEDILIKTYLVKRYTNFSTGVRTITVVSSSCFKYTPFRMYDKQVLADVFLFSSDKVDEIFPSVGVGDFLTRDESLASTYTYPKLLSHMEKYRSKAHINSMPWLLPLISGNKVIESLISDDVVMESLCDYHIAAGDWGQDMYNLYVAEEDFVNGRGSYPVPKTFDNIPIHQDHDFPLEVIFSSRSKNNTNAEARLLEERVDQVRSANEQHYWATNTPVQPANSSIPKIIIQTTTSVDGGNGSIKSTPSGASKEKKASDRLTVFMGLLFASPVLDSNGEVVGYIPTKLMDNMKEVFESVSSTTDQTRMIGENLTNFSVEVSEEKAYLPRCTRYPFLPLTFLTYLMYINLHLTSIDGDPESLDKTFNLLALLPPRLTSQMNTRVQCTRVKAWRWKSYWSNRRTKESVSISTSLSKDDRKRWKVSSILSRIPFASVALGFK